MPEPAASDQKRALPANPPRPVYRGYDVGIEFNKDYVESMYRSSGRDLALYLFDNNGQPLRDTTGRMLSVHNQWERGAKLALTESEARWIQMINQSDCAVVDTKKIPAPSSLTLSTPGLILEPQKLYEARLLPALMQETFAYTRQDEWLQAWSIVDHPGARRRPSQWQVIRETVFVNGSSRVRTILQQKSNLHGVDLRNEYAMPGTYVWRGERTWSNYQLSVLLSSGDNDAIGVLFRYQNDNNYYRYSLDLERGYRRLVKKQNGRYILLAQERLTPGNPAYVQNQDLLINVEVSGAEIKILQDGKLAFRVVDKDGPILTGAVGLYCWANHDARFKDVRVLAKTSPSFSLSLLPASSILLIRLIPLMVAYGDMQCPAALTIKSSTCWLMPRGARAEGHRLRSTVRLKNCKAKACWHYPVPQYRRWRSLKSCPGRSGCVLSS